ncbi:Cystathionine beta-lyase PatB [Roseovarius albus]|uniref:cysteine-S-conjugate beta-lyase n=1 Tax=Roseovarius albus TaxID=1247867 RepID=A0A1X6YKZ6_9RHOB|nr:PatB family C-S lyase [Roseovarius albus]SLN22639.1 Cystathionine beta-lyase PatB [Roseovarius albus]
MSFDDIIDRHGTNSTKWDGMAAFTGVSAPDGIAMWIADKDFAAPDFIQEAAKKQVDLANYGYFTGENELKESVAWWMKARHNWEIKTDWITNTYGLGNAIALCINVYSEPGDEIIMFTPVYHEFTSKVLRAGRTPKQWAMPIENGVYQLDLEGLEATLTGKEKVVLFCSPHNPAGRIWTPDELRDLSAFCARNDLVLVSDDIHHDLVYPGQTYTPMLNAAPDAAAHSVILTASSKTFSTAGVRLGSVTIPDAGLRERFKSFVNALNIQPNLFGKVLTQAAYSERGAAYVDELAAYLDGNHRMFLDGMAQIPGVVPMPMQATYLSWMDFTNTGMNMAEVTKRVKQEARVAPSIGAEFGKGGENFLRFNIALPRPLLQEALERLQTAFADLQ